MEFFCFHRDRPGSMELRLALLERHWSYMDGFASRMVARGPTFVGDVLTGSVHVLDLPDAAVARAFAFDEPGYQAGVYRDVVLHRFRNELGRDMWQFRAAPGDVDRHLVLALGPTQAEVATGIDLGDERLIVCGPLLSDDATATLGAVALVEARDPDAARAVIDPDRFALVEVHRWRFGGRS